MFLNYSEVIWLRRDDTAMSALQKSSILPFPTDVLLQFLDLLECLSTPAVFLQHLYNSGAD